MALSQKRKFTFTWQIQNFSMCPQKFQEVVESPVFLVKKLENLEWQLALYPKGCIEENFVSCYLRCKSLGSDADAIQVGFTIVVFSDDVTKQVTNEKNNYSFKKCLNWGIDTLISRDVLLNDKEAYLPNNTLSIKCSLWRNEDLDGKADPPSSKLKTEVLSTALGDCIQWDECTTMTRFVVQSKRISWPIRNFSSIDFSNKLAILVPSALKDVPSFFITLSKSITDQSAEIEIQREKNDLSKMTFFKCKVSVLHTPKGVDIFVEDEHLFESNVEGIWKFPSVIKLNKLEECKYLSSTSDTLHLLFEFSFTRLGYVLHTENVPLCQYGTFMNLPHPIEEFRDMYKEGELSDVTIRAGDREFKVHKIILKARSPVFRAMFDNDMKEKETGVIDITDVDPDTMDRMLAFMYTNAIEDVEAEDALKLYSIADKYHVLPLKYRCSWVLASSLCVSNVCHVLTLANRHDDEYLRGCAENFVFTNSVKILKSEEWENLMKTNSGVAAEVMLKMLTN